MVYDTAGHIFAQFEASKFRRDDLDEPDESVERCMACDLLILDEVLGLVEKDIITEDDLKALLECRGDTDVILTGITLNDEICVLADEVSKIETVKFKVWD